MLTPCKAYSRRHQLECYSCAYNTTNSEICIKTGPTLHDIPYKQCDLSEHVCMVKKLEENGKIISFVRSCAKTCYPSCITMNMPHLDKLIPSNSTPKKMKSLKMCYDCCSTDLCNISNNSNKIHLYFTPPEL
ncbi:unnamed protein product [Gordionus sp. m RMFG-2023]